MPNPQDVHDVATYARLSALILDAFLRAKASFFNLDALDQILEKDIVNTSAFQLAGIYTQGKLRGYYDALFDLTLTVDTVWREDQQAYCWKDTTHVFCAYAEQGEDKSNG